MDLEGNVKSVRHKECINYRMGRRFKNTRMQSIQTCERCLGDYTPNSPGQKYCPDCKPIVMKEYSRLSTKKKTEARRKNGVKPRGQYERAKV